MAISGPFGSGTVVFHRSYPGRLMVVFLSQIKIRLFEVVPAELRPFAYPIQ
jgi:hypothetical protein